MTILSIISLTVSIIFGRLLTNIPASINPPKFNILSKIFVPASFTFEVTPLTTGIFFFFSKFFSSSFNFSKLFFFFCSISDSSFNFSFLLFSAMRILRIVVTFNLRVFTSSLIFKGEFLMLLYRYSINLQRFLKI